MKDDGDGRGQGRTRTGGDKAEPPPQLRDGNGERARGETASKMGTGGDEGSGGRGRMRRTTGTGGDKTKPPPQLRDGNGKQVRGETASERVARREHYKLVLGGGGRCLAQGRWAAASDCVGRHGQTPEDNYPAAVSARQSGGRPGHPTPLPGRTCWATQGDNNTLTLILKKSVAKVM